jgi:hypothetical protein
MVKKSQNSEGVRDPRKLGQALRSWEERRNHYLDQNLRTANLKESII